MKQKIRAMIFAVGSIFATQVCAMSTYYFQTGIYVDYELPANEPLTFVNGFMWTIKASCKILSSEKDNYVNFKVLRKEGSINNIKVSSGESIKLLFHPDDMVHIMAISGGKVELTNLSKVTITARYYSE